MKDIFSIEELILIVIGIAMAGWLIGLIVEVVWGI